MKKTILILGLFFYVQIAFTQSDFRAIKENPDTVFKTLRVINIEERKQDYIIVVVQDSIKYVMVSLKTKQKNKNCVRLKKGKEYDFLVTTYFEIDMLPWLLSDEVIVDGVKIYVPMKGANVFLTPNLKGLCYTKPEIIP
jgi:hypothetical protein